MSEKIEKWEKLFPLSFGTYIDEMELIVTNPRAVSYVSQLRKLINIEKNTGKPTHVLMPCLGESPNPIGSKIGGIPLWPRNRKWPKGTNGQPLLFFAQINFSDSMRLFNHPLPGSILYLFTEKAQIDFGPDFFFYQWLQDIPSRSDVITIGEVPVAFETFSKFYSIIYDWVDYYPRGDTFEKVLLVIKESRDEYSLTSAFAANMVFSLCGFKIGGIPYFTPREDGDKPKPEWEFLFSLSHIWPPRDTPYSFENIAEPIPLGNFSPEFRLDIFDGCNINFFLDIHGGLQWTYDLI